MTKRITDFLIGSDPEAIVGSLPVTGPSRPIGAFEARIPGTKKRPVKIGEGCAIQVDNTMVEWCIPPSDKPESIMRSIQHCIDFTQKMHPCIIMKGSSAEYSEETLGHTKAKTFGCDPDWNAWNYQENPIPSCKNKLLRTAAGHIHLSYANPKDDLSLEIVRALDLFLGVPAILLDPDKVRRKLYGKSGSFRFKPYGLEYRVLSNFWIWDVDSVKWMFNGVKQAIEFINGGNRLGEADGRDIQKCINTYNTTLVPQILSKYEATKCAV